MRKEKRIFEEENKVINEIKSDSKAFYRYKKRKSFIRSKIGPFNIKGRTIDNEAEVCAILSKQYEEVGLLQGVILRIRSSLNN